MGGVQGQPQMSMEQPTRVSKLSPVSWIKNKIVCARVNGYIRNLELLEQGKRHINSQLQEGQSSAHPLLVSLPGPPEVGDEVESKRSRYLKEKGQPTRPMKLVERV